MRFVDEREAAELRRRSLRFVSVLVAPIALLISILALTLNVGETVDSYCGSVLSQDYGWRRDCTTNFRVAVSIAAASGLVAVATVVAVVHLGPHSG